MRDIAHSRQGYVWRYAVDLQCAIMLKRFCVFLVFLYFCRQKDKHVMGKINSTTIKFLRNEIIDNGLGAEDNVGDKNIEMLKPLATKLAMVDPRMQGKVTYKASTIMLAALAGINPLQRQYTDGRGTQRMA